MSDNFIMQMRPWFGEEEKKAICDYMDEDGFLTEFKRTEESKRILLVIPPQLLKDFQRMCDEESYALVEGIREAMRRMIQDTRPDNYESPKETQRQIEALLKFIQDLQGQQDPSTLPSQRNTLQNFRHKIGLIQACFANIPVVFTIPELFAISEPTKIAAATSTMHPDWAMSNWYEMMMPETVAVTAKHIEIIMVCLKERE